jgi:hypothetical protein
VLIERTGYLVRGYHITASGRCPDCDTVIPGVWPAGGAQEVPTGDSWLDARRRLPRRVQP